MNNSEGKGLNEKRDGLTLRHTGTSPLLHVIDGLQLKPIVPNQEQLRYCHFYRPPSGYHLSKDICKANRQPHISEAIDEQVLYDIRNGKCLLIIDNSPEGHIDPQRDFFIDALRDIIFVMRPSHPCIVIDQNRALTNPRNCSESFNSLRTSMHFLNYDFHIKKLAVELTCKQSSKPFPSYDDFSKALKAPFLCLFGTPRPAKIALLKQLTRLGLIEKASYSYHGFEGTKAKAIKHNVIDTLSSSYLSSAFYPLTTKVEIESDLDMLPLSSLDVTGEGDMNKLALHIPYELFFKSHASLVVETEFSSSSMQRITEKTFKALAAGHPSIIFGNPFSVSLAREIGFDTFDDIIDHSYDTIVDPSLRFGAVLSELERLVKRIEGNAALHSDRVYKRALSNYAYAHSGDFVARYNNIYEQKVISAIRSFID